MTALDIDLERDALARLRATGGLVEMVEMAALLELSRLSAARLDLGTYLQSVVDVVSQFFRLHGCAVTLTAPGLPALRAVFGELGQDRPWDEVIANGGVVDEDDHQAHPLRLDGAVRGMLAARFQPGPLSGSGFFAPAAAQLSSTLDVLVETERLRRRAAVADALQLVASVVSLEDEVTEQVAAALAALPGVSGAALSVQPERLPIPFTCTAGLVGPTPSSTAHRLKVDDTDIDVRVAWSSPPTGDELEVVDRVLQTLTVSLGRASERRRLEAEVETDPLTGVGNRRRAGRALAAALRRAGRFGESVAVVMLDIDHFKRVNDTLGHPVGDNVLSAVGKVLESERRAYDTAARLGGEEFVVICPTCDGLGGLEVAERLRARIRDACTAAAPGLGPVTASAGVAVYPENALTPDQLLRRADEALYEAKRQGRDRAVVASTTRPAPANS